MTDSFSIPLQPLTTATGTQSSEPITIDVAVWDAIAYWQDCSDADKEEAAAFVRQLLDLQKKGTQPDAI